MKWAPALHTGAQRFELNDTTLDNCNDAVYDVLSALLSSKSKPCEGLRKKSEQLPAASSDWEPARCIYKTPCTPSLLLRSCSTSGHASSTEALFTHICKRAVTLNTCAICPWLPAASRHPRQLASLPYSKAYMIPPGGARSCWY